VLTVQPSGNNPNKSQLKKKLRTDLTREMFLSSSRECFDLQYAIQKYKDIEYKDTELQVCLLIYTGVKLGL
jgi:hypothetical protein